MKLLKRVLVIIVLMGSWAIGNAQTNTFPSSGDVGIGTTNPLTKFHLKDGSTGGTPHSFSTFTVEGTGDPQMISILTSRSEIGYYGFADEDDSYVAGVRYNHSNDKMNFRVNNHSNSNADMTIASNGYIGIGTTHPGARLAVNGATKTKEVIVTDQSSDWPDYVFNEGYKLQDLRELETFVKNNKHLPEMSTQEEIEHNGQNLGAVQAKLLQKIEELTLYTIEQQKRIEALEKELKDLRE